MLDGNYLVCPNPECKKVITQETEYKFEDVSEEPFTGRDLITFQCLACQQHGTSYAFIEAGR